MGLFTKLVNASACHSPGRTDDRFHSHWLVSEEIQEPQVFRRCAAESRHGRRLARIVIGAAIARQEFDAVEFDAVSIKDSMKLLRFTPDVDALKALLGANTTIAENRSSSHFSSVNALPRKTKVGAVCRKFAHKGLLFATMAVHRARSRSSLPSWRNGSTSIPLARGKTSAPG